MIKYVNTYKKYVYDTNIFNSYNYHKIPYGNKLIECVVLEILVQNNNNTREWYLIHNVI